VKSDLAKSIAAVAAGEKFFTGKVCAKHPDLKGKRRAKSRQCPACIRERMSSPHNQKRRKERRAERIEEARRALG
jgi:hypothetical protein